MAQSFLPSVTPFIVGDNPTSVGNRWDEWLDRFENFLAAMDIKDATRKRAMLLHCAGEEVHKIFRTLEDTGEAKDYTAAKTKLTAYFKPQQNIEYERYIFGHTQQNPSETLDQYHTRLRHLASTCEFTDASTEIKSQIILQCKSSRLRRRALQKPKITLKELLDQERALETSETHPSGMEETRETANLLESQRKYEPWNDRSQRKGTEQQPGQRTASCYNCGGIFPHRKEKPCPAQGKICRACDKPNHFARYCKTTAKEFQAGNWKNNKVNNLDELPPPTNDSSSSEDEYAFGIQEQQVNNTTTQQNKICQMTTVNSRKPQ